MTVSPNASPIAFREGFLAGDLSRPESVRLAGSRCGDCGIALFGKRHRCENCSSKNLAHTAFSSHGVVHSFTIQRYPPPKPNACPEPWSPRPLAWVDLADQGPRIMAPIDCDPEQISIGSAVTLQCGVAWRDAEGHDVMAYKFVLSPRSAGSPS
jgi:hypothetical protein